MFKNRVSPFFIALLIYASTIVFAPQTVIYSIIALIGLLFLLYQKQSKGYRKDDLFLIFFLLLSFLIFFIGNSYAIKSNSKSVNDLLPYSLFIISTIGFSKLINNRVIKFISYLILLEVIIGIVQYIIGVPYFIKPIAESAQEFGESDYFYYNKVYGLSAVTSVFALKIFIGFLLVYYVKFSKRFKIIAFILLSLGLLVTFNRTAIVGTVFFTVFLFLFNLKTGSFKLKLTVLLGASSLVILGIINAEVILEQFFRGKEIDFSGRDFVFEYYSSFIEEHLFFGNYFIKHWVELQPGRIYHAHNSYLQTFANMGVILGGALLFYLFKNINKRNVLYIFPILIYSGFQYGILWGVSFLDIIFFYFLLNHDLRPVSSKNKD